MQLSSEESCFPQIMCASGMLSLKLFWKFSSLSKELLTLRYSPDLCTGLGGIAANLSSVSEHSCLLDLLQNCIDRDDVGALQQLLPLRKLKGTIPGLLGRAIEKEAESCFELLSEDSVLFCPPEISDRLHSLKPKMLRHLLEKKVLDPNMWIKADWPSDAEIENGKRCPWASTFRPILNAVLDGRNFDCAQILLDFGARVDVCEWEAVTENMKYCPSDDDDPYEFYTWNEGMVFLAKPPFCLSSCLSCQALLQKYGLPPHPYQKRA